MANRSLDKYARELRIVKNRNTIKTMLDLLLLSYFYVIAGCFCRFDYRSPCHVDVMMKMMIEQNQVVQEF